MLLVLLALSTQLIGSAGPAAAQAPARESPVLEDATFPQEFCALQVRSENAAENALQALAVTRDGTLWLASRAGVRLLKPPATSAPDQLPWQGWAEAVANGSQIRSPEPATLAWQTPQGDTLAGPAYDVAVDEADVAWIAGWDGLYRGEQGRLQRVASPLQPVAAVATGGGRVVAGGPDGLIQQGDAGFDWLRLRVPTSFQALLCSADAVLMATQLGLHRGSSADVWRPLDEDHASLNVRCLARDPSADLLWSGSSAGLDCYHRERRVQTITPAEGLPSSDVRSLALDTAGTLWIGTGAGLARRAVDGRWSLRHSRRWLPHDEVRDVALWETPAGSWAWVATADGLSLIAARPMTLAEKAEHFLAVLRARHVRPPGLVEKCRLESPGDTRHFQPKDTDNDGMYTAMYAAAECFRYAVTGDASARQHAQDAYAALELLQTVTGTPGMIARTVVPSDWAEPLDDANRAYPAVEIADNRLDDPRWKYVETRWRPSADGKWLWKGDTSSDEITGHFFLLGVYYDLVADAAQRPQVADHARRVMDGLIAGGFQLRDVDGQPTYWGVWAPEKLNEDPNWLPDRGVNSVELLSYLITTWRVTGDDKYLRHVESLLSQHDFARNILQPQRDDPALFTYIDAQLLALAYRSLLVHDPDSERQKLYRQSVQRWYRRVGNDRSPFYGVVYHLLTGARHDVADWVATLRDAPWDLVLWTVDQRQREDVRLVRWPYLDSWQVDRLLPADERAILKWDSNPYAAVAGEDGRNEGPGTSWLLPYWMARYQRLIGPAGER